MSKSDSLLRGQISKLEGSLKNARDKNSKDSSKKKDLEVNYADMTLILADVSNKMDSDRFEVKYNEQQKRKSNTEETQASEQHNTLTKEEICDLEPFDDFDEDDGVPYPSMSRFGALMPTLNETESQIDLRDFNELKPPEDTTNASIQHKQQTESNQLRDINSDQSEDYEPDTPQQEDNTNNFVSFPVGQDYSRESSEEFDAPKDTRDYTKPTSLIRNRTRSKTIVIDPFKDPNLPSKSSRSYSQTDPNTHVQFKEHYYLEDSETYAKPSLVIDTYNSDPVYADDQLEDYDADGLSPLSIKKIGSLGSDSDSEYDKFIHQHKDQNTQQPPEETRAKSPYYHQPVSKSSLASYPQTEHTVPPQQVVMRQKSRAPEQQKRLTMPHTVVNYEESAANSRRSPNPYSKHKTSTVNPPDGKLMFRSFQSARDSSPYDTVFSARKGSIQDYAPNVPQYEPDMEVYNPVVERQTPYKHASQKANFNRNKSTNHRNYVTHSRQDILSPISPPVEVEVEYEDDIPYETTINAAEIMNRHPHPEYGTPHHYANLHHTTPRSNTRQQPPSRNMYATPQINSVTPVNRNYVYVPNNDTSPVQSLDSGIASLYNDISYRPRTVAAQVSYYRNDFDYEEPPIDNEPNMEEIVLQLKNELKLLSSKIQLFEDQGVTPAPTQQVMSPTGQKYPVYSQSQLRSVSVASSSSEGGRAKQEMRSPQIQSPNMSRSPVPPHHQALAPSRYSQHSQEYPVEYAQPKELLQLQSPGNKDRASAIPQTNYIRKPLHPQKSTPSINRPSSVSKITSNTSQDRISNRLPRPAPVPTRPMLNRTQGSNVPRAQSSTGTATYTSIPALRLQTPRYTPVHPINRSISPLPPKTSARKPVPLRTPQPIRPSRMSDGYHYDEDIVKQSRIPNPSPRFL